MPARIVVDVGQEPLGQLDFPESDPALHRLLRDATFDPVEFLNSSLPPFPSSNVPPSSSKSSKATQIQDTATQVQGLLAKLNAQNIRYSNALSQLTDEILRSGGRLAYEVEILRGDVNGLHEVLTDTLQDDIKKLGLGPSDIPPAEATREDDETAMATPNLENGMEGAVAHRNEPDFIPQLRMLSQVKARLEEVISIFGEAMEWPLAPSELSITSSLISVSAPEPGSDTQTREEKARDAARKLRSEVISLLDSNGGGYAGLDAAAARVESLRSLTTVWKGTAEEKPRAKFIESLAKVVDDRKRVLDAGQDSSQRAAGSASQRSSSIPARPAVSQERTGRNTPDSSNQTGGLLRNLQRLRDDFYLD
jgi:hypothetical protein